MSSCYICGSASQEQDHFPVSKSLGGTDTVPICLRCHDLKDRIRLDDWDPDEFSRALERLWTKATSAERLVLAKIFHIANQGVAALCLERLKK